jgi:hypothetical protein
MTLEAVCHDKLILALQLARPRRQKVTNPNPGRWLSIRLTPPWRKAFQWLLEGGQEK